MDRMWSLWTSRFPNHWIRECQATSSRSIRNNTISKVQEHLEGILYGKGTKAIRKKIFNVCSEIAEFSLNADGGEQVWVGILPEALTKPIDPQLPRTELTADRMQIPIKWRTCITKILTTFQASTRQLWQTKVAAQCQKLDNTKQDTSHLKKTHCSKEAKMFGCSLGVLPLNRHNRNHQTAGPSLV